MAFVGLIGCGNLGSAMLSRWLAGGADRSLIKVVDNHPERLQQYGIKPSSLEDIQGVDVLMLAVKPWNVADVLNKLNLDAETIVVSMAAGLDLETLSKSAAPNQPICRVMPNIGIKLGLGVLAIAFNEFVSQEQRQSITEILQPLGRTVELKEIDFNAVTALAGSGPAFVSLVLESLVMGGIAGGLSSTVARALALETATATIELIKSGMSFEEIRFLVSSPAGTTMAGLELLERDGVRGSLIQCVRAASSRARELGEGRSINS